MKEMLSDRGFRLMHTVMRVADAVHPHVGQKAKTFGIAAGMTVVDYGCGPGRYTVEFARQVGERGKVIAVDLKEIALEETRKKAAELGLHNIQLCLADGYDSHVETGVADIVFALDMFHMVEQPPAFLRELSRIAKDSGTLVLDDGHQLRSTTKRKLSASGAWKIVGEHKRCLVCRKA